MSKRPIFLFFLINRGVVSSRGAVDMSFDRYGPSSISICVQELAMFQRNFEVDSFVFTAKRMLIIIITQTDRRTLMLW
uniref:Hypothetical secreted peptide n=1 Tax=Glossina morsitans morsitans TaxID=37546 RepID=D3TSL0_GLOMM